MKAALLKIQTIILLFIFAANIQMSSYADGLSGKRMSIEEFESEYGEPDSVMVFSGMEDVYTFMTSIAEDPQKTEDERISAMINLAGLCEAGNGCPQSYEKALEWAEKAADLGSPIGVCYIGKYTAMGIVVEQDYEIAIGWYEYAFMLAEQNAETKPRTLQNVISWADGLAYDYFLNTVDLPEKAIPYFKLAADCGDAFAASWLGSMYMTGLGTEVDYQEAEKYLTLAADQGDSISAYNLGYALVTGDGLEQDVQEGLSYLVSAYENGYEAALYQIFAFGYAFEYGPESVSGLSEKHAIHQSNENAVMYYTAAAELGSEDAKDALARKTVQNLYEGENITSVENNLGDQDEGQSHNDYILSNVEKIYPLGDFLIGVKDSGEIVYVDTRQGFTGNSWVYESLLEAACWKDIEDITIYGQYSPSPAIIGLKRDGTVVSTLDVEFSTWRNIIKIVASDFWIAGLRADGTVAVTKKYEISEYDDWDNGWLEVSDWTDVVDIVEYSGWTVMNGLIGVTGDGAILSTFPNYNHDDMPYGNFMSNWRDISEVCCTVSSFYGLRSDGTVAVNPDCYSTEFDGYGIRPAEWTDIVQLSHGYQDNLLGVRSDGTVAAAMYGYNDGKLVDATAEWSNIRSVASAYNRVVGLTNDGKVIYVGTDSDYLSERLDQWRDIREIAIGGSFIAGLRYDGTAVWLLTE